MAEEKKRVGVWVSLGYIVGSWPEGGGRERERGGEEEEKEREGRGRREKERVEGRKGERERI